MIAALTTWLALVAFAGAATFAPGRWRIAAFVAGVALSAYVALAPLGAPDFRDIPPGEYTVLGARIDKDVAIYVLLDDGKGVPAYYVLPYTEGVAQNLQEALDGRAAEGGVVGLNVDGDGDGEFGLPAVTGSDDKVPEQPAVTIGE